MYDACCVAAARAGSCGAPASLKQSSTLTSCNRFWRSPSRPSFATTARAGASCGAPGPHSGFGPLTTARCASAMPRLAAPMRPAMRFRSKPYSLRATACPARLFEAPQVAQQHERTGPRKYGIDKRVSYVSNAGDPPTARRIAIVVLVAVGTSSFDLPRRCGPHAQHSVHDASGTFGVNYPPQIFTRRSCGFWILLLLLFAGSISGSTMPLPQYPGSQHLRTVP
jgi:hypothetical protein